MATWNKNKVNANDVNNGNQFNAGDGVRNTDINKIFESGLYSQNMVENISVGKVETSISGGDASASVTYNKTTGYPELNLVLPRGPVGGLEDANVYEFVDNEYLKTLNKFNFDNFKMYGISQGHVDFDYNNKTITLTNTTGPDQYVQFLSNVQLNPNTTYTYGVEATGNYDLLIKLPNGQYPNISNAPLTFTTDSTGIVDYFRVDNESLTTNTFSKFMLNEGDTLQPYQDGKGDIVHKNKISAILLWENTNLNVEFPQTQLFLPRGRRAYVSIDFIYFSSHVAIRQRFTFRNLPNTQGYVGMCGSEGQMLFRRVTINSDSITFDDASPTNNYCVPVSIYEHD